MITTLPPLVTVEVITDFEKLPMLVPDAALEDALLVAELFDVGNAIVELDDAVVERVEELFDMLLKPLLELDWEPDDENPIVLEPVLVSVVPLARSSELLMEDDEERDENADDTEAWAELDVRCEDEDVTATVPFAVPDKTVVVLVVLSCRHCNRSAAAEACGT